MSNKIIQSNEQIPLHQLKPDERGAALILAVMILMILGAISVTVLAVVSHEIKIAGSDLRRTETYSATVSALENMTNQFSALFQRTSNPTAAQLDAVAGKYPTELTAQGFTFTQSLKLDQPTLDKMSPGGVAPYVDIEKGQLAGLKASVTPYKMTATAINSYTGARVTLERTINNYLVPLFQFGMFSDKDIELHPGPAFTFNGRIHTNGNLYLNGNVTMLDKVTVANELVYDVLRNGSVRTGASVKMMVGGTLPVSLTKGSVVNGPNFPGAAVGARGYNPTSPNGSNNATWTTTSANPAAAGTPNQFGGQLLTRSTGATPLVLPLQLGGSSTIELIKRSVAGEAVLDPVLSKSRYHTKSEIRIIIDDESMTGDAAGIPTGQGLTLSNFNPIALDGGNALRVVGDNGSYSTSLNWAQGDPSRSKPADTVRGIRNDYSVWTSSASSVNATASDASNTNNASVPRGPGGGFIPTGAGIKGRILIQIVAPDGTTIRDVTKEVLSMGMTEGEPNGIVYLQRPLWAAFMQGSRDRDGGNENLEFLTSDPSSRCIADGEIDSSKFSIDASAGFYNTAASQVDDDAHTGTTPYTPTTAADFVRNDKIPAGSMNRIVPINVYNPREGWINSGLAASSIYERGMTSVIEINMRNLARWVDGVYDNTLLKGTPAISANIDGRDGYVVYISDRRGDRRKTELDRAGKPIQMTNGTVDNEDIYGPNNTLDPGEDVLVADTDKGTLQKDTLELPDPSGGTIWTVGSGTRRTRAETVQSWANPNNYFRRSVRLFNASNLQISGATGKLSTTKGITISTENMVYIWGSYNTTGIAATPAVGTSTLVAEYLGPQVPSSIVADAIFPLSRTWSDSMSSINPEGGNSGSTMRTADVNVSGPTQETSVRAAVIAGTNMSALTGSPDAGNSADSRLSGGIHNFPRFLENWLTPQRRWNFVGSLCPLYYSTQALGPWTYINQEVYGAPTRNWAFDTTFRVPTRLPPGTPQFQYIEATGFRQVF